MTGNYLTEDYLKRIHGVIGEWLQPKNRDLSEAIDRTVKEGYFSFADISHQLRSLKKRVTLESLAAWSEKNRLVPGELAGRKALCLHAGNLPFVGFQDFLACLITGIQYTGKISRKDPYLLPSLLKTLKTNGVGAGAKSVAGVSDSGDEEGMTWSTDIDSLFGANADCVLFSGSGRSVKQVRRRIGELKLAKPEADYLVRTAHFSLAYIDSEDPKTMQDLTEAVFRYGGKGCRSVAVVISPYEFEKVKCSFTDYIESFWLKNPQHNKPQLSLFYRYAYNKAVGHSQSWLDDFLIEETTEAPDHDFVLHWVTGDEQTIPYFISQYGSGLQSVYVIRKGADISGLDKKCEMLSTAQNPPIDWEPDGIDTIEWLLDRFRDST
ncbi:MAG: acyl-CoA reductase [Balneolaceae bacterium]